MRAKLYYLIVVLLTVLLIFFTQKLANRLQVALAMPLNTAVLALYFVGVYTFTARAVFILLVRYKLLRCLFLGPYYLEGT